MVKVMHLPVKGLVTLGRKEVNILWEMAEKLSIIVFPHQRN